MNNNDFPMIDFENIDMTNHNNHRYLPVYIVQDTFVNNMQHIFGDERRIPVDQMINLHTNNGKYLVDQYRNYFDKLEYWAYSHPYNQD
jgi:hypothetical protein